VLREARIMRALEGSAVPVPRVLAVAGAGEPMDVPLYVMEHLDGVVATTQLPAVLDEPGERRRVGEHLVDALAALAGLDLQACGLHDLGEPEGFLARQLERLPRIIAADDGSLPEPFGQLRDALRVSRPVSGPPALVHGDLRLGNVMLAADAPARLVGVLDWELATLGDPLADLGYSLATYAVPGEPLHALTAMSAATQAEGFSSREELALRYAAATGRDIAALPWYEALALWKLAVLFEYSRRKATGGEGDPYYLDPTLVPGLLEAAQAAATALA
jgi:aminoglycoside phosphotransferase (APT) family kinase protein